VAGLLFCCVAFVTTFLAGRASVGRGAAALLTVGYSYGILRARFLGLSHFAFDAALLGLYVARLSAPSRLVFPKEASAVLGWLVVLAGWPFVVLVTGFLHDQHVYIQVVGFRAAVWMLPCLWLGATLRSADLRTIARALGALNLAVLPFAVAEYFWGIEPFFPRSVVTELMYRSKDIATLNAYRIPATFTSAAPYGGVMIGTVPLLFGLLEAAGRNLLDRLLATGGLLAAAYGAFACGSRTPVAHLLILAIPALFVMRRRAGVLLLTIALGVAITVFVARDVRLQRFRTLEDPELVLARLQVSANAGVVDVILKYPLGVGLGGAFGTSIPGFLAHLAKKQIGAENEFSRIGLELGVVGLLFWIAFLLWYFARARRSPSAEWQLGRSLMYFYTVIVWATAFIGTGILTGIPATALLLLQMGYVARKFVRPPAAAAPRTIACTAAAAGTAAAV
jgi:hypothetical protein